MHGLPSSAVGLRKFYRQCASCHRSRAADLLHLFLDRPGELITKSEIMDAVWPNTAVEESNPTVQISALRRALGGSHSGARYIQTVLGRGYGFTSWVDEFASRNDDTNPKTQTLPTGPT
jgi:DNA-binding winged helix-turn-helix (wHTH) protein